MNDSPRRMRSRIASELDLPSADRIPALSRQRGGIARTLSIVLGVIAVGAVAVIFWAGQVGPEEIVAMRNEDLNQSRGVMLDDATRFERASANGTSLVVTYTLMDGWREHLGPMTRQVLGDNPTVDEFLAIGSATEHEKACAERRDLGAESIVVIFEMRDERGNHLSSVEANASSC